MSSKIAAGKSELGYIEDEEDVEDVKDFLEDVSELVEEGDMDMGNGGEVPPWSRLSLFLCPPCPRFCLLIGPS